MHKLLLASALLSVSLSVSVSAHADTHSAPRLIQPIDVVHHHIMVFDHRKDGKDYVVEELDSSAYIGEQKSFGFIKAAIPVSYVNRISLDDSKNAVPSVSMAFVGGGLSFNATDAEVDNDQVVGFDEDISYDKVVIEKTGLSMGGKELEVPNVDRVSFNRHIILAKQAGVSRVSFGNPNGVHIIDDMSVQPAAPMSPSI